MYIGHWEIDDLLTFYCNTHDPETAGNPAIDADAVPGYRLYEDETGTPILTGSMAKLDDANTVGWYSEQITLSAANGFDVDKSYVIRITAVVGGITQVLQQRFQVEDTVATVTEIGDEVAGRALILHSDYDAAKTAATQTSVDDLPTNAELATSQAAADDATLAAIAALNNLSAAQVNTEMDTALADIRLDELLAADSDIDGAAPPTVGSVFHELMTKTAGSFTYDQTTDALEAIRDNMGTAQTGDSFARLGAPAGASVSADIAAIEAQTDDIGIAGAGLTAVPWNAAWDAEVQSEVQDAIEVNHLDHLLAVTYDPASQPGVADALLNELIESDAGVSRYTANALAQAPTGGSAPTVGQIADGVWDELLSGHAISGSTGEALSAAGTAGDPWTTALPGAYGAGTAGKIIGDNVNATISSRATQTSVDTIDDLLDTEVAAIKADTAAILLDTGTDGVVLANDAITAAKIAADAIGASEFAQGAADKVWSTAARTLTAATNITSTGGTTVPQTGDSFARLGAPAGASVSADIAAVEAQTDDIGVAGAGLTAIPWNASWDAEVQSEVADALEVTIADSIPADGTIPSVKQALYMLTQFMLERSVATTTVTVKKADGSTTLFTLTLDDATTPTSITRAT
jgi:hypothetical protein